MVFHQWCLSINILPGVLDIDNDCACACAAALLGESNLKSLEYDAEKFSR